MSCLKMSGRLPASLALRCYRYHSLPTSCHPDIVPSITTEMYINVDVPVRNLIHSLNDPVRFQKPREMKQRFHNMMLVSCTFHVLTIHQVSIVEVLSCTNHGLGSSVEGKGKLGSLACWAEEGRQEDWLERERERGLVSASPAPG